MNLSFDSLTRYISDKNYRFRVNCELGLYNKMNDRKYLERRYFATFGSSLNLDSPVTFNEKIQWLKLHDRKEQYVEMVDKCEAKKYVSNILGQEFIIPTYGVWDNFDDIELELLPNQFVLKCTHDSGGNYVVRDKNNTNWAAVKKKLSSSLKKNYYYLNREWPYLFVKPRIIAEMFLDGGEKGLRDYKFFNFNGSAKFIYVSEDLEHHDKASISFYDLNGNKLPFRRLDYRGIEYDIDFPPNFEAMLNYSNILASRIDSPFVRTDFYNINGKIYFSEITFSPCGGMLPFSPPEWDKKIGALLNLPESL